MVKQSRHVRLKLLTKQARPSKQYVKITKTLLQYAKYKLKYIEL